MIPAYFRTILRQTRELFPSSHYALLSLVLFAGLELAFAFSRWIVLVVAILLAVIIIGVILIRREEGGRLHFTQIILPAFASLGLASFALFLPTNFWLHIYFAGGAFVFFQMLKRGARKAYPTWNWVITMVVLFTTLASLLGWRFHLYAPVPIILGAVFVIVSLISVQSLLRVVRVPIEAWLLALSFGFVITEIAWTLQFLPLHFIVQAGALIAVYYIGFQLIAVSYEHRIDRRDVGEYLLVGGLAAAILFITARWT